jgi:hypothetical protein
MDSERVNESLPPPVPPPGAPLEYRAGGREAKSQWWTDGDAYGAAMVYALMGLAVLGAVGGVLWWVVSHLLGWWFGW